jgi:hypothetical protein
MNLGGMIVTILIDNWERQNSILLSLVRAVLVCEIALVAKMLVSTVGC